MNVSRRRYMGEKGGSIPYQRIEYLENTATQYINFGTGELTTSQNKIYAKISPTFLSGTYSGNYRGIMGKNAAPQIGWYTDGWTVGNAGSQIPYAPEIGKVYEIEYSKNLDGSYWVDGVNTGLKRTGNIPKNVFWCQGSATWGRCKLYRLKIFNSSNEEIFDFIPVRIGTTGYMYDRVSGELFGNVGTDDFVLGPDIN